MVADLEETQSYLFPLALLGITDICSDFVIFSVEKREATLVELPGNYLTNFENAQQRKQSKNNDIWKR